MTDNPEEQYLEALAGETALAVIETFDIRAACMHLIYAAHVTTLDRPWEEEFVIDDAQISSYMGLDKRKDLTKEQRLKLIERISEQPAQILTFLHWPQQGNVESFYVEKSRLWEVAIGYHGQRDIFGDIKCTGLTIRCRAGMWAKYFLNKRGAEEGNAFYQYGVLSKTLLQTITRVWQHSEGAIGILRRLSDPSEGDWSVSTTNDLLIPSINESKLSVEQVTEFWLSLLFEKFKAHVVPPKTTQKDRVIDPALQGLEGLELVQVGAWAIAHSTVERRKFWLDQLATLWQKSKGILAQPFLRYRRHQTWSSASTCLLWLTVLVDSFLQDCETFENIGDQPETDILKQLKEQFSEILSATHEENPYQIENGFGSLYGIARI